MTKVVVIIVVCIKVAITLLNIKIFEKYETTCNVYSQGRQSRPSPKVVVNNQFDIDIFLRSEYQIFDIFDVHNMLYLN